MYRSLRALRPRGATPSHRTGRRGVAEQREAMEVRHEEGTKFYITLDTEEQAVLQYSTQQDGSLDLYHTEVPASQRGKGVGGVLAEAALSYAREKGLKVTLTCTYVQHYVSKHPEHNDLTAQ